MRVNGKTITPSEKVKYLGILIDIIEATGPAACNVNKIRLQNMPVIRLNNKEVALHAVHLLHVETRTF